MIISRKHKFIFSAYQKTGTTSIEAALSAYQNRYYYKWLKYRADRRFNHRIKHLPPVMIRELVGHKFWNDCFCFTFTRNPWDRVLSLYSRHQYDGKTPLKDAFTQWVLDGGNWLAREQHMIDFISDEDGNVIVDYVGKLENMAENVDYVCGKIGIPTPQLPRKNTSSHDSYHNYYTDETRRIVSEWKKRDIEYFGYEFGSEA